MGWKLLVHLKGGDVRDLDFSTEEQAQSALQQLHTDMRGGEKVAMVGGRLLLNPADVANVEIREDLGPMIG